MIMIILYPRHGRRFTPGDRRRIRAALPGCGFPDAVVDFAPRGEAVVRLAGACGTESGGFAALLAALARPCRAGPARVVLKDPARRDPAARAYTPRYVNMGTAAGIVRSGAWPRGGRLVVRLRAPIRAERPEGPGFFGPDIERSDDMTETNAPVNAPVPVGIDLGYGYIKAVGPGGEFLFPALTARMARSLGLADIFGGAPGAEAPASDKKRADGYRVELSGSVRGRFAVGSLARLEGGAGSGVPFDEDRRGHEGTRVLLAVAAALASGGAGAPLVVATGMPPGYLDRPAGEGKTLREAEEEALRGFQVDVAFQNGPFPGVVPVRVAGARVFPQAAGGVFHALSVAGRSLGMVGTGEIGVVDVGYKTTDFLVLELETHNTAEGMSGSLEVGTHLVANLVAEAFHAATGGELPQEFAEGVVASGNAQAWWRGRQVDLSQALAEAREAAATAVYEGLRGVWRGRMDTLRQILVMGGGGALLGPILSDRTEGFCRVMPEPQMANAKGFAEVARRLAGKRAG